MIVTGLDIATSTGVCFMDTRQQPSEWRCFAIESEGGNAEEKASDLALALSKQIGSHRPDFCAIEQPQRSVTRFRKKGVDFGGDRDAMTINPNALQLSALAGAAVAVLDLAGIPWGLVHEKTWRAAYFGKGFKPSDDWKQAAIHLALMQKIVLPPTKKAARDAAEAVGIARAWQRCGFVPERHRQAFMALRTGVAA